MESSPAEAPDKSCILFIYKELRNERGEPGYYTRFKFTDNYGNTTNTVDIDDVIELRRLYLAQRPDYLTRFYAENPSQDSPEELTSEERVEVLMWFYLMQKHNGLTVDDDVEVSSASTVRVADGTNLKSDRSNIPSISQTIADASFSKSSFGLSASLSHTSSFKYGLTSTTIAIH